MRIRVLSLVHPKGFKKKPSRVLSPQNYKFVHPKGFNSDTYLDKEKKKLVR